MRKLPLSKDDRFLLHWCSGIAELIDLQKVLLQKNADASTAFILRDVFELDYHEIADILDKSESATRQVLHRARVRARGTEAHDEAEESYLGLCYRAIEAREPALLMEMLQGITALAQAFPAPVGHETGARSASRLVQINGRYAIALVLDGGVLCIVPVGVQVMRSFISAERIVHLC